MNAQYRSCLRNIILTVADLPNTLCVPHAIYGSLGPVLVFEGRVSEVGPALSYKLSAPSVGSKMVVENGR